MALNITIKVSPGVMKNKAYEMSAEISRLEAQWRKLESIVKNSRNYWEGEASEVHQAVFRETAGDVEQILKRLGEHPTDLLQMADLYDEAEARALQYTQSLPDDVIS